MVRIRYFSPLEFALTTWEFHDDKMVVKVNSPRLNDKTEKHYEEIKGIVWLRSIRGVEWVRGAFILAIMMNLLQFIFTYLGLISSMPSMLERVAAAFILALLIPAFFKYDIYAFLDTDGNHLFYIKMLSNNKNALSEAIRLIEQKTEINDQSDPQSISLASQPVFQTTEFDFPNLLNRSTAAFYANGLILNNKNLVQEVKHILRYQDLSEETVSRRVGNPNWNNICSYWLVFVVITHTVFFNILWEQLCGNPFYTVPLIGSFALLIPMYLLKYIKSENLSFYDRNGEEIFSRRVTAATREQLNKIVEFLREKVPPQASAPDDPP